MTKGYGKFVIMHGRKQNHWSAADLESILHVLPVK